MHFLNSLQALPLLLLAPGVAGNAGPATVDVAPRSIAAEPSPATLALLASSCFSCHGPQGRSTNVIPSIAGQPESRLLQRMQSFKAGTAAEATIMTRLMKGYDEDQIKALARWFAEVKQ